MRLKITGKNITLTEGIKEAVKEKVKKFAFMLFSML